MAEYSADFPSCSNVYKSSRSVIQLSLPLSRHYPRASCPFSFDRLRPMCAHRWSRELEHVRFLAVKRGEGACVRHRCRNNPERASFSPVCTLALKFPSRSPPSLPLASSRGKYARMVVQMGGEGREKEEDRRERGDGDRGSCGKQWAASARLLAISLHRERECVERESRGAMVSLVRGKRKEEEEEVCLSLSLCFSRGGRVEGRRRDEREVVCGVDRGVEGGRRSPATPARA